MAGLALAIRLEAGYELYEFDTLYPSETQQRYAYLRALHEGLRNVPEPD